MQHLTTARLVLLIIAVTLVQAKNPTANAQSQPPRNQTPPVSEPGGNLSGAPLAAERERSLRPKDAFKECDNCPEMIVIPAGSFMMGSPEQEPERRDNEGPQHRVTFARGFAVAKFSVSVNEFAAFVGETGYSTGSKCYALDNREYWSEQSGRSWRSPGFKQDGTHPVVCVNWEDAKAYVSWLSRKTGKPYRLLSEAEREYVARSGTTTPFWWGSNISSAQANYDARETYNGGRTGEFRRRTLPVNSFEPNPFGLYQVHGNVDEWVEDCGNDNYNGAPSDGSAWTSGNCRHRVLRGEHWFANPGDLRAASRWHTAPTAYTSRRSTAGFRVARTLAVADTPPQPSENPVAAPAVPPTRQPDAPPAKPRSLESLFERR